MRQLPMVSVVFIGYKRPDLLEKTVLSFLEVCDYPRARMELILSDDGSPAEMVERMKQLPFDKHVLSDRNYGLGHNSNKGLKAATGDYIFHLQDDWLCRGPGDFLRKGILVLEEYSDVGMVRFHDYWDPSICEERHTSTGETIYLHRNKLVSGPQEYGYSDRPHLKRRSFHERFGYYIDGANVSVTEVDFCRRFESQQEVRTCYISGPEVLEHIGDAEYSYNPGHRLDAWRTLLLRNPATRIPFRLFLAVRHGLRKFRA